MKIRIILFIVVVVILFLSLFFYFQKQSAYAPADISKIPVAYSGGASLDHIEISSPRPGDKISSPLQIVGKARGTWYFEASFPIFLTDGDGLIIAQGVAQAQTDWMTKEFVPFQATVIFAKPANASAFGNRGTIIIKNDNPSGDPERDMAVEIPVMFE